MEIIIFTAFTDIKGLRTSKDFTRFEENTHWYQGGISWKFKKEIKMLIKFWWLSTQKSKWGPEWAGAY